MAYEAYVLGAISEKTLTIIIIIIIIIIIVFISSQDKKYISYVTIFE